MPRRPHIRLQRIYGLLGLCFLCCMADSLLAQTNASSSRRANQRFEEARREIQLGEYDQAIELLQEAVRFDSLFAEAHQGLGDLLRRKKDFKAAIPHYKHVLNLKPDLTYTTWFGLGESLLFTGQYEEALGALRQYEKRIPLRDSLARKVSTKYIADCQFSLEFFQRYPLGYPESPENLGPAINTPDDEYFPKLTADGRVMIFTRKANEQENFYKSTLETHWTEATLLQGEVNSTDYNEGAHGISPDGKYLYFTGCNRPDGLGSCDIYVSRREGERWGKPQNLGAPINTSGWEAQPALSADGSMLYFVSNRAGGMGGYDIWRSRRQADGTWGTPENLGPTVNTAFDESAPFVHADNQTLYFSSNGWPGFGGKDVYRSSLDSNGQWQTPINLGFPINDYREQSAWSVSMNGVYGYFSSVDSEGLGGLDIFRVELAPANRPPHVAYITAQVLDEATGEMIPGAHVRMTQLDHNRPSFQGFSDPADGTFLAPMVFGHPYALHVDHPDYLFHSSHYSLQDTDERTDAFHIVVALKRMEVGRTEILMNTFFEVGDYQLLPESLTELAKLYDYLKENPTLHIEIGGHTDSTGNHAANQILSERRAAAVRTYLIDAGIEPERIQARGYASSKPLADNSTEEGRRQNRRTDFRIIKHQNDDAKSNTTY